VRALLVIAELRGAVAWGADPIHFDGLLGAVDAIRHPSRSHPSRVRPLAEMAEQHLPLAKPHVNGSWCWLASAGEIVGPHAPAPIFAIKRRDVDDWDRLARPVNVTAGPGKDYMIRSPGRVGAAIRFVCWGDRAQIRRDLKLLLGPEATGGGWIGPLRRMGCGQVSGWSIEPVDLPPSACLVVDGHAVRHLPASWVEPCPVRLGAHAPPYWHPERQVAVVPVGAPCQLRPEVIDTLARLAC
jgi:CRISPR type IV-associated protein Csf3